MNTLGYWIYGYQVFPTALPVSAYWAFHAFDGVERDRKVVRWWKAEDGSTKHLLNPHLRHPDFRELIEAPLVKKFAAKFFERAYVTHSKISLKEPGKNHAWLPHQDSGYKERSAEGFTVAVFLERADESNGSLQVYPGSHLKGRIPHSVAATEGDFAGQKVCTPPAIKPVTIEAEQGTVMFFSLDLVHQSPPNMGTGKRLIFFFEVEEYTGTELDDRGKIPLLLTGKITKWERAKYLLRGKI